MEDFLRILQEWVSRDFQGIPGDFEGFLGFLRILQKLEIKRRGDLLGLIGISRGIAVILGDSSGFQGIPGDSRGF